MSLANPLWLFLLAPLAFAAWRLLRHGRKAGIRFSAISRLPSRTAGWRAKVAALTPFLLLAGLALLVVAAARPRSSLAREKKSVDAIAIAMTVDVSGSMMATDLASRKVRNRDDLSRLDVVKDLFAKFVEKRPDDLIGLVTYATYAATVVPLTADHDLLLHALKGVRVPEVYSLDANGRPIGERQTLTAVGDGLSTALLRLKDSPLKSKIVILLSDGASNTGAVEPDEAARAAAKLGIKVYVIGMGVIPEYVEVPDGFFGSRRIKTSELSLDDVVRLFQFDEKQLKSIAKTTGGTYFAVNDKDSLEKALEEIDQLETTQLDADVYNRWREHFAGFLLAGALLVLVAVTLSMSATRRMA